MDGEDRFPAEQRESRRKDRDARKKAARQEGTRVLALPANSWANEWFRLYFDLKDFAGGTSLADLTPVARAAFRAIREGSGGSLGNPPVF